ncbi:cytochrome P450 family protein [Actinomadura rupiterrae]|uniref:cytochrome P450 family protein n=1 Tax=Actinomadura rupiterrae TaxID=559627 RepID=UPI0020A36BF9|nr:cytochrome P450 [Actinomadura rupiterrae]MCP2336921.1 cytochrome P450 [Actinomadura rupiterrae]
MTAVPSPAAEIPVIELDPTAADHHGEAARLRAAGPVVRVVLPGGVRAWAVTTHELVERLVRDPDVSKDYRNWTAVRTGELADDNPIIGMIKVDNLVTADGAEHTRLRRPIVGQFTRRRVQDMVPAITGAATALVDALPATEVVDLRAHFAARLPLQVICELLGVPADQHPRLRHLVDAIFRTDTTAEEVAEVQAEIPRLLGDLIAARTAEPGGDLTSALIGVHAGDPAALSAEELAGTLWVLLTAGHETTISLISNAVRAMLTHPDQLAAALSASDDPWPAVVAETLRWDAPIGNFPARYPLTDLTIGDVTIPAGDAIIAPYTAVNRDPAHHGPDADRFDHTRAQKGDLAFGAGRHSCPGSFLAETEACIALSVLFDRYPKMTLAVPADSLPPVPSLFTNSIASLPVRLTP